MRNPIFFTSIFTFCRQHCAGCSALFPTTVTKHHCRNCGEGFCETCSSNVCPVPLHGWHEPVRVCDGCFSELQQDNTVVAQSEPTDPSEVRVRRYGEMVVQTISSVANVLDYPKGNKLHSFSEAIEYFCLL